MIKFSIQRSTLGAETAAAVACESSDRELLLRYLQGDESAFSTVVQRHAGLVMGVCQRILRDITDAEDAFQATFLVLARKAGALKWNDSVAGWLHDTARRTALKLRSSALRRSVVERRAADASPMLEATSERSDPCSQATMLELSAILDEELSCLSTKFREVILLSQIEGLGRDELAARLGITTAAVKDRLERGREQLRMRLVKRGVTLSAVTLAAWLVPGTANAGSTTLMAGTAQAATAFAAGNLAVGSVSAATTLAQGVLTMMGLQKLKMVTACMVSLLTAGTIAYGMLQDEPTRFEKGLKGEIVSVSTGNPLTVTISLEESEVLLNLDVSERAKVWTAYEPGQLADLIAGQYVSVRLGDDNRTVNEIHVQGTMREASIHSITESGKIVIVNHDDDEDGASTQSEVELAPGAIVRIGGLPAARSDLKPGMEVPLEFGRDGNLVNAIEADAAENSLIDGDLLEVDLTANTLRLSQEGTEEGQSVERSLKSNAETIVTLDGQPAKLADLAKGAWLTLRLSDDGQTVRVVKANSPENDEDEPPAEDEPSVEDDQ